MLLDNILQTRASDLNTNLVSKCPDTLVYAKQQRITDLENVCGYWKMFLHTRYGGQAKFQKLMFS